MVDRDHLLYALLPSERRLLSFRLLRVAAQGTFQGFGCSILVRPKRCALFSCPRGRAVTVVHKVNKLMFRAICFRLVEILIKSHKLSVTFRFSSVWLMRDRTEFLQICLRLPLQWHLQNNFKVVVLSVTFAIPTNRSAGLESGQS